MYFNGNGVIQDSAEAMEWHRLAAEQGHAAAQYFLGFAYNQRPWHPLNSGMASSLRLRPRILCASRCAPFRNGA
jgi:TPR repeat protein